MALKSLGALVAPLLLCCALLTALLRGVDVYDALLTGARRGLRTAVDILPALLVLYPAIYLLRASGLPEQLERLLSPAFQALGIPPETGLLLLLRPLTGSGAMSEAARIMETAGPDSLAGRTAAVMMGSSETTFYVAAVYLSAAGVKRSRWAIPAALCADLACFLSAAWACRLFWG
jgi:spore maturation protein B